MKQRQDCRSSKQADLGYLAVQERLGHSSAKITLDTYGHIFRHGKDKEITALEYWEAKTLGN